MQMPLSKQEHHCIKLTCNHLSSILGGNWEIATILDELYPNEPTPEVIVSNGDKSAVIEIKRLTGDAKDRAYKEYTLGNRRYLQPTCGGFYYVSPPDDLRLPLETSLRKHLKQEVERVAQTLKPGEWGVLKVARSGHIAFSSVKVGTQLLTSV